ncbi:MAG: 2Fe-2S ferredoxin [Acinetobacter sp.]|nr:2Fe-2S ferredoxin [Acinetobacter sp.]
MGQITFVEHDGTTHQVDLEADKTLMQLAKDNYVPGIDADCGGACACGTCHVFIDDSWISKTGSAAAHEIQMLNLTPEKTANSRLACQIELTTELDGLIVHLPESQM